MVWIILAGALQVLLCIAPSSPSPSTSMRNSLKINPKPCSVNNVEGRCMFVWECINTEGHHLGMCVDTFMFGSCCSHNLNKSDATSVKVQEKTSPTLLYTKPSTSVTHKPSPYTHKTSPSTHKTSPSMLLTKPSPGTTILYSKPIRQTQRPLLSYYSHKDISSNSAANTTQRPYLKPPKESLGRPVNVYSNNEKIDDFSTERYQSTESNGYQLFSSSNTHVYTSWTKPPTSTSSQGQTQGHTSTPISSAFTLKPSIYYTSKPSLSSSSSHYLDSWSSDSNNEVESHMETSWSQKPTWHVTSPLPFVTRPRPSSNLKPNKHKKPWLTTTTSTTTTTTTTTTLPPPKSSPSTDIVTMVSASLPLHMGSPTSTTTASTHRPNATLSASNKRDIPCGKSPLVQRHEVRIVGGQNSQFGEWPWQVSVRRTSFFGFSSTHRCGGALLNPSWIATAGHCVDDLLTSQIKIRVGEFDFSKLDEPYPYQERGVSKKMVHPRYNFFTYEYDLALVQLETPVELAPNIVPICLPGSDDLLIGENATVTGWGRLSEGGSLPPVLQKVTVPIVSNEKCRSMFLRAGRYEFISDIFMCAGFDSGGRDSCQGDSGGPLQVKGKDGRYFLAGIISWGIGCAEANLPGVCTRISKFVPWILDTVT